MLGYYIQKSEQISWTLFTDKLGSPFNGYGQSIAHVLNEVREVFINIFGRETVDSHPLLAVVATDDYPITFYEYHLIALSSKGNFYCQHIYQFAHELCHFMVAGVICESYRWFEETLCEMMSWYVLLMIYERRKFAPLVKLEPLYNGIEKYVLKCQSKRVEVGSQLLPVFVSKQIPYLRKNCYNRVINSTIGYGIFPLFQAYQELWNIVLFLNTLTDDMPLRDALDTLLSAADVIESRGNQLKKRLSE